MASSQSVLALDVGTSRVRAVVVDADGSPRCEHTREIVQRFPAPGRVEFDAAVLAEAALDVARRALAEAGPVAAVGVSSQRASTIVWERAGGRPVAPGIGWQDLRTRSRCADLHRAGLDLSPNQSATKLAHLLDEVETAREGDLCFGTVDCWLAWVLTEGALHVTDAGNASATGLWEPGGWQDAVLDALAIPRSTLPSVVDSAGRLAPCSALPGAPVLAALLGDQQASLLGQGCVVPGAAKLTAGTGAMLDVFLGGAVPGTASGARGTFPIVAWRVAGRDAFAREALMLAAGSNVDWLCDGLGILARAGDADSVAGACEDSGGVTYVPALLGLGTPHWDLGARGLLLGLTRGTGRAEIVRAVLEGVAQRAADLVEAAASDTGLEIAELRVDGGMTGSRVFLQALADATGLGVEVAPVREATALGAGLAAGAAVGLWPDLEATRSAWRPGARFEPQRRLDRARWSEAVARASSRC